jgi:hypothetical protein
MPGAVAPTVLAEGGSTGPMAWSADGSMLAHGVPDVSGDGYDDTRIIDVATGRVVHYVDDVYARFVDWQPCPDGPCEVWGDVSTRLSVAGVARRRKVVASGTLDPAPGAAARVELVLQRRTSAGGSWRRVDSVRVIARHGEFTREFGRPKATRCRVTATYEVSVPVSPDRSRFPRDTDVFRC